MARKNQRQKIRELAATKLRSGEARYPAEAREQAVREIAEAQAGGYGEVDDAALEEAKARLFAEGRGSGPRITDDELAEAERRLFDGGRRLGDVTGGRR